MAQRIQTIFSLLLAVGLVVTLTQIARLSSLNRDQSTQLRDIQARIAALEGRSFPEGVQGQTSLGAQRDRVQRLKQRVADQTAVTEVARQRLDDEKSAEEGSEPSAVKEKLGQQQKIVDDLRENLRNVKAQESTLKKQIHADQAKQTMEQSADNDQLNAQIAQQRQVVDQLSQQLAAAKETYGNNQFDMQAAQNVKDLTAQVAEQRRVLRGLTQNASQKASKISIYSGQNQQRLDDLEELEQSVSDQLSRERQALRELQNDVNAGSQSEKTHQALIQNAETDYQIKKARLDELQSRLETEQSRLDSMQNPR